MILFPQSPVQCFYVLLQAWQLMDTSKIRFVGKYHLYWTKWNNGRDNISFWAPKSFVNQWWKHACIPHVFFNHTAFLKRSRKPSLCPKSCLLTPVRKRPVDPFSIQLWPCLHFQAFCTLSFLTSNLSSLRIATLWTQNHEHKAQGVEDTYVKFYGFVFGSTRRKVTIDLCGTLHSPQKQYMSLHILNYTEQKCVAQGEEINCQIPTCEFPFTMRNSVVPYQ